MSHSLSPINPWLFVRAPRTCGWWHESVTKRCRQRENTQSTAFNRAFIRPRSKLFGNAFLNLRAVFWAPRNRPSAKRLWTRRNNLSSTNCPRLYRTRCRFRKRRLVAGLPATKARRARWMSICSAASGEIVRLRVRGSLDPARLPFCSRRVTLFRRRFPTEAVDGTIVTAETTFGVRGSLPVTSGIDFSTDLIFSCGDSSWLIAKVPPPTECVTLGGGILGGVSMVRVA